MLTEGTELTVGTHNVKVVRYLSEGGFSKIYEVIMDPAEGDTEIGCLKQVLVPDKNGLNTLRKEVDVMKTLKKARSIVKYFDSNAERLSDGSYQVLVLMELCPNKSLLEYMNDRIRLKLTEPEILKILLDISIGVYEMHKIKLIHRDIKIENVLIDAKNNFKLCDFGSVSVPIRPPQHQQEFQLLGHDILYHTTPQYRSPEMIDLYRGHPIDERSDIWALGCFLYKLCYYITPFEANGDIAILHASFQFPPAPIYSGDLKNLIIIMLQENPLYRPNIVQILILVAKLMGIDYTALKLEDFYGAGEYNFQALYDMQREKQNQLLKQQQYYFEQQKQQQAYELSKQKQAISKGSLRVSLLHPSRENSVHAKDEGTPNSSIKPEQDAASENAGLNETTDLTFAHPAAQAVSSSPVVTDSPILKTAAVEEASPDEESLDVDLPELDHIAERYPSLDEIDKTNSADDVDLERKSSLIKGRASLDSNDCELGLKTVSPFDASNLQQVNAIETYSGLDEVDAWQNECNPKGDERAEKLADEIFAVGSDGPQRSKSATSSKSARESRQALDKHALRSSTPGIFVKRALNYEPVVEGAETAQSLGDVSRIESIPQIILPKSGKNAVNVDSGNLSAMNAQLDEKPFSAHPQDRASNIGPSTSERPEPKRGASNPWGTSISSTRSDPLKTSSLMSSAGALHMPMNDLHLGPSGKIHDRMLHGRDLIDLEEPTRRASIPIENRPVSHDVAEAKSPRAAQKLVENSLIDMDFVPRGSLKHDEGKPAFKKRLSDAQTQPLSLQEQVIDFASDDENHSSEMSRVAIRKSLKKSRKHSDHKQSEPGPGEGKKRLSFFSASSD